MLLVYQEIFLHCRHGACITFLKSNGPENIPIKTQQSLWTLEVAKKSDLLRLNSWPVITTRGLLSVQIETVRLNGKVTLNMVQKLCTVLYCTLSNEVAQLKGDNTPLKAEFGDLKGLLSGILKPLPNMYIKCIYREVSTLKGDCYDVQRYHHWQPARSAEN